MVMSLTVPDLQLGSRQGTGPGHGAVVQGSGWVPYLHPGPSPQGPQPGHGRVSAWLFMEQIQCLLTGLG